MTQRQNGYSLIELIIALAIMGILATMVMANFRAGEKQRNTQLGADAIMTALRTAQNYSQSGKKTSNTNTSCQTAQYYYVDFNSSTQYSLNALNNCSTTDTIQVYTLPRNIRFRSATVDGVSAAADLKVLYTPPFAKTTASRDSGPASAYSQILITIESSDAKYSKTVTANGISGSIQ